MILFNSRTHGYEWLSNFYYSPIVDKKHAIWPTAEHAYQGQKTVDPEWRTAIRKALTPARARRLGDTCPLRPDWDKVKKDLMFKILKAKFLQNDELRQRLFNTGGEALVHEAPWDSYWGNGTGDGRNELGKMLMKIRDQLRAIHDKEPG